VLPRPAAALLAAALLLPALASPARALDAETERARIADALETGYREGYRAGAPERILELYAPEAQIVTFVSGALDREGFGALLTRTMGQPGATTASTRLLEVIFPGEDLARATFRLRLEGQAPDGQVRARDDLWIAELRCDEGHWVILRQSYRSDFLGSPDPHKSGAPVVTPLAPGKTPSKLF